MTSNQSGTRTGITARLSATARAASVCACLASAVICTLALMTPVVAQAADTPPTPKLEKSIQLSGDDVTLLGMAADGTTAVVLEDDDISFVNIDSGEKKQASVGDIASSAMTKDGGTVFIANNHGVTAYDVKTATATPLSGLSISEDDDVTRIVPGSDNKTVAVVTQSGDSKRKVQIYDVKAQQVTVTRDVGDVNSLLVSNDLKTVYTIKDATVEAMNVADGAIETNVTNIDQGFADAPRFLAQLRDGTIMIGDAHSDIFTPLLMNPANGKLRTLDGDEGGYSNDIGSTSGYHYDLVTTNADYSTIAVATPLKFDVYDALSSRHISSMVLSGTLINMVQKGNLKGGLITDDGKYMYRFDSSASDSSDNDSDSDQRNTITVYDTSTGANIVTTLPDGMTISGDPILSDMNDKLVTITQYDGSFRLSIFSSGASATLINPYSRGGAIAIIIIGALLIAAAVVVHRVIRAIRDGKPMFTYLKPGGDGTSENDDDDEDASSTDDAKAPVAPPAPLASVPAPVSTAHAAPTPGATPPAVPGASVPVVPSTPGTTSGVPAAPSVPLPTRHGAASGAVPGLPRPAAAGAHPAVPLPARPGTAPTPSSAPAVPSIPAPAPAPTVPTAPSPAAGPRFCSHCGAPITNPNARFCTKCGHPTQR